MESSRDDAAAQIAAAERVRETFTTDLRLPRGFHALLGMAAAVLMGSVVFNAGSPGSRSAAAASVIGVVVFLATAGYLMWRFRVVNGAQVAGLFGRAICGSTWSASVAFCLPLGLAAWAAIAGAPWLAVLISILGGAAYAVCAQRWWAAYRREPVRHTEGDSTLVLTLVLIVVALGGIVLVSVSSR